MRMRPCAEDVPGAMRDTANQLQAAEKTKFPDKRNEDQADRWLAAHGYAVLRDQSVAEVGRGISAELGASTKVAEHLRVVVAERR